MKRAAQRKVLNLIILLQIVAILALAGLARAQDASVIQLDAPLAAQAQALHQEQLALDAKWEALLLRVVHDHLEAPQRQTAGCVVFQTLVLSGWGCAEFQFSTDYRFIVPAAKLSLPPYDGPIFQLVNGVPTAIKEKPTWQLDAEAAEANARWVWNNTPNSETDAAATKAAQARKAQAW